MLLSNGQTIKIGSNVRLITEYGTGDIIDVTILNFNSHNDLATVEYLRDNELKWVYLDQVIRVL